MHERSVDELSRSLAGASSRRQVLKLLGGGLVGGGVAARAFSPAAATAKHKHGKADPQAKSGSVTQPVTGTVQNGGTFSGTYTITKFAKQGGSLVALGTLSGTLTDALGQTIGTVTNAAVTIPINLAQSSGTCQILHLDLGPLDLNLLGLMVHLNEVVLDITAQSGPGNLLGNLLCSIAHLLDSNGALNSLVQLLNHLLGAL